MQRRHGISVAARFLFLAFICGSDAVHADSGFVATPIARGVFLVHGYECNITALAGNDGVIVVDTCGGQVDKQLLDAIKRMSDRPIRFVINTHAHGDHTGGDSLFQTLAPVIAHDNVRKRMATGNEKTGDKPVAPEALPMVTFKGEMTLHLNGEDVRLVALPPGHTDGDVAVIFTRAKVACLGDVYMSPRVAFADRWYGGSNLGLIESLELILSQIPADTKIIPGHGAVSSREDVAAGLEVLKQMKAVVESAVHAGKTLDQLTTERPFDKWRDAVPEWDRSDKSLDGWVRDFYRDAASRATHPIQ